MIEIKRNCSSNVRDYDGSDKIQFNDFTISIKDDEYKAFMDVIKDSVRGPISPQTFIETLSDMIEYGIWYAHDRMSGFE